MVNLYIAEKGTQHSVTGVKEEEIALYASRGYTVYVVKLAKGEVYRFDKKSWKLHTAPTGKSEGLLEAPQDILHPKEAARAKASIRDVGVARGGDVVDAGGVVGGMSSFALFVFGAIALVLLLMLSGRD